MKTKKTIAAVLPVFFIGISILFTLIFSSGCSYYKNKDLNIYLKLERPKLEEATILILNFKEPAYAQGAGGEVGEMFHLEMLRTGAFKVVSLNNSSTWFRLGVTEEEQLQSAMEEARNKHFDYLLVGEVRDYYYGGTNKTRVKMKVRVIEVETKTTIFLAENGRGHKGSTAHFPMSPKLAKTAKPPRHLAAEVVYELVRKIKKK